MAFQWQKKTNGDWINYQKGRYIKARPEGGYTLYSAYWGNTVEISPIEDFRTLAEAKRGPIFTGVFGGLPVTKGAQLKQVDKLRAFYSVPDGPPSIWLDTRRDTTRNAQ